jgi:cobalamin biosynthesis Co2+ chelatase CbiK
MEYDEIEKLISKLEKDFEGIKACKKIIEQTDPEITLKQLRDIRSRLRDNDEKITAVN